MPIDEQGAFYIPIEKIQIHYNVRTDAAQNASMLAEQIRQAGRLQQPIGVKKTDYSNYELVWGHRRLEAMRLLGWMKLYVGVHVIVLPEKMAEKDFYYQNLLENVAREDPSPVEIGKVASELHDKFKESWDAISVRLGKKYSPDDLRKLAYVYQNTPEEYQPHIGRRHGISRDQSKMPVSTVYRVVSEFKEKSDRKALLDAINTGEINVGDIETITYLKANGMTIYRAIEEVKLYRMVYLTIPVNRMVAKQMEDEHGTSIVQLLLRSIKFRDIHIPKELIFMDALAITQKKTKSKKKSRELLEVAGEKKK